MTVQRVVLQAQLKGQKPPNPEFVETGGSKSVYRQYREAIRCYSNKHFPRQQDHAAGARFSEFTS